METQLYTVVRDGAGRVTELQFWCVQGQPSFAQIARAVNLAWPGALRNHPERLLFAPRAVCFSVTFGEAAHGLPLVEERVPNAP